MRPSFAPSFGFRFAPLAALLLCLSLFSSNESQSRTLHVSKSGDGSDGLTWESAYNAISDALAVSASADEIWVASGTYQETIRLMEGVALYGGFAGNEATGEFELRDWESHETIVDASGFNDTAVVMGDLTHVDGFTITGGHAKLGGGVRIKNATASVLNCRIVKNRVEKLTRYENCWFYCCFSCIQYPVCYTYCDEIIYGGNGGGILVDNSDVVLLDCIVESNNASLGGGIHSGTDSNLFVINCRVSMNAASEEGAGIYIADSYGMVDDSVITENNGAGFFSVAALSEILDTSVSLNHGLGLGMRTGELRIKDSTISFNYGYGVGTDFESNRHNKHHLYLERCLVTENNGGGLSIDGSRVFMKNSTISHHDTPTAGGAYFANGGIHNISNCFVYDNQGGAFRFYNGWAHIYNCQITDNVARGSRYPISISSNTSIGNGTGSSIINCTIAGNKSAGGIGGISIGNHHKVTIRNSILWNHGLEVSVRGRDSLEPSLMNNCISGGWLADQENLQAYPLFNNPLGRDWRLQDGSPCIDRGRILDVDGISTTDLDGNPRISGPFIDMGAFEAPPSYEVGSTDPVFSPVLLVDADSMGDQDGRSWESAYHEIEDALLRTAAGTQVWIAAGRYNENLSLRPGVSLLGSFAGIESSPGERDLSDSKTVISGAANEFPVIAVRDSPFSWIDGLCVENGRNSNGGGLYVYESNLDIGNSIVRNNTATSFGGGIYCELSLLSITRSLIISNTAMKDDGGGIHAYRSRLTLSDMEINENRADENGGGISSSFGDYPVIVERCRIANNRGGSGAYFTTGGPKTIRNCIFENNRGWGLTINKGTEVNACIFRENQGGLSVGLSDSTVLNNCLISKNTGTGILVTQKGNTDLYNCSIVGNEGVGIVIDGRLISRNCIHWNDEDEFQGEGMEDLAVSYSNIRGGWTAPGVISADPRFFDISVGDLRLAADSPCIDSGTDVGLLSDLDGNLRPVDVPGVGRDRTGDEFDMGAYEFPIGGFPTWTPTPVPTSTHTPTMLFDEHTDGQIDARDLLELFDAGKVQGESAAAMPTLFHFSLYWRALDTR